MSQANHTSRGMALEKRLACAVAELKGMPIPGSRDLPVIQGVTSTGIAEGNLENVLVEIEQILVNSKRVYLYGNGVVLEASNNHGNGLLNLSSGNQVEKCASATLANLFICQRMTKQGPRQFFPPEKIVQAILLREPTRRALPRINSYSRRPVFDR